MPAIVPLIIAGVSTGAELYSANKQADTAKAAAKTQVDSGNQALALQQQQYQQQQRNLSPYLQAGQAALGNLNRYATPPPMFTPPGQAPRPTQPFGPPQPSMPSWDQPWMGPK